MPVVGWGGVGVYVSLTEIDSGGFFGEQGVTVAVYFSVTLGEWMKGSALLC